MEKKCKKNKVTSKTAIMLNVVAGLLLVCFLLSFYNVTVYIKGLMSMGSITFSQSWLDIFMYYINSTSVYLALAALLFGMGYVVSYAKKQSLLNNGEAIEKDSVVDNLGVDEAQNSEIDEAEEKSEDL